MAGRVRRHYHKVARCRWCGEKFYRVFETQWFCKTKKCQTRQKRHAIKKPEEVPEDESPYIYLPTPAQVELHESKAPNLLWGGSAGGSKTFGLRWDLYKWCQDIPNFRALLLRRTFPELERTHLLDMRKEGGTQKEPGMLGPVAYYARGERRMLFENGSFIEAGHCESANDMMRYLSSEYDQICFDEWSTFDEEPIVEISSRARSSNRAVEDRGGAFVRGGSNPGGPGALYLRDHFILGKPDPEDYPRYNPAFLPVHPSASLRQPLSLRRLHRKTARHLEADAPGATPRWRLVGVRGAVLLGMATGERREAVPYRKAGTMTWG